MAERPPYPGDGEDPGARDGAGGGGHEEGPIGAGAVFDLADAIEPRYRVLVLVLAFVPGVSRQGILSCRRRHLDLPRSRMRTDVLPDGGGERRGERAAAVPQGGSDQWASLPPFLVEELSGHLDDYAQPGADGYVFTCHDGGPLDLARWHKSLRRAREAVGLTDIRPHDLHRDGGATDAPAGRRA